MSFLSQTDRNGHAGHPYVVQSPVEIARLGPALRQAYERNALPSDMQACLDKLDRLTGSARN
ncbi:hypothetical protein SPHINGOAX6_50173 [Sphingomonas sp. AX6]|nr:hypothetical protein SPHINGOAX6_50173 [Sphingomonas sp. AX6]